MLRETQPPRANARPKGIMSPQKGSVRMPLNDDREEKSVRFKSRHALHEMQINQIKAAASPAKQRRSLRPDSPRTPNSQDKENEGLTVVGGSAVTPMKRVPILANFEEWMKMATDNKINATNSWNFALIDYFYDMSLLKEGDSVNFQKASCTLDGCVKIYTSRVDSVATETGKLLSGLADSGSKKRKGEDADGGDGEEEDEEEGEEGVKKRARKRAQRSSEATLAPSFAQLQLKKMELEFAVDPLFKKASADFDEGGAKGLLLNHLTIDAQGRIVFDSSDDLQQEGTEADLDSIQEQSEEQGEEAKSNDKTNSPPSGEADVDLESLGLRFFPDLDRLDDQDICPSLKTFELGGATDSLDIPFLKAPDDWKKDSPEKRREEGLDDMLLDDGMGGGMDDDDDNDGGMGGFDLAADVGFGEGGEAWAKEAAIDTQLRPHYEPHQNDMDDETGDGRPEDVGGYDPNSSQYGVHLSRDKDFDRENILSYFDQAQQKNWAGPEHWRIRKIKDASKPAAPTTKRKEKEPFEIDFAAPMTQAMADMIYTPASSNSAISLPKSQWKSKTRNLLPDDKHFNSRQLLSLFLKPKARIGSRRLLGSSGQQRRDQLPEGELDEAYWARQQNAAATSLDADESVAQGNYDANFFQDDGLGAVGMADDEDDGVFADAQERLSPSADQQPLEPGSIDSMVPEGGTQPDGGFGSQLVTQSRRLRPEYVQYARVAKKVDVRRLKEEMWRGIGFQDPTPPTPSANTSEPPEAKESSGNLKFTSVMNNLQAVYPKQAMEDISTSYCFICLLHLANEKGLVLEHNQLFEEINIQRDATAEITEIDA